MTLCCPLSLYIHEKLTRLLRTINPELFPFILPLFSLLRNDDNNILESVATIVLKLLEAGSSAFILHIRRFSSDVELIRFKGDSDQGIRFHV